jgi:hypothetical protein
MKSLNIGFLMMFIFGAPNFSDAHEKEKFSKYHDIGFSVGGAFYNGDLNPYKVIDFDSPGFGAGFLYRLNFDRRNSLRFGANYGFVYADDATNTDNPFQRQRGLNFQTNIFEVNSIYEFNFFPYEMGYGSYPATPYIFGGIGGYFFNPIGIYGNDKYVLHDYSTEGQGVKTNDSKQYSRVQLCLPFGVGVKANLGKKIGVQIEWGIRKLFTDYLDDVSTKYPSYKFLKNEVGVDAATLSKSVDFNGNNSRKIIVGNVGRMRGNSKNNDWYSFIGISFTYKISFGAKCPSFN